MSTISKIIHNLTIRTMDETDYSWMAKWLNDENVLEYYGPRLTLEQVIIKYGPRIEGNHSVKPYIVEYKRTPIGYLQYYPIQEDQLGSYGYSNNPKTFGIDQFIGETSLWEKGIGTAMIRMFLAFISVEEDVFKVLLDVKSTNVRAIRYYEKCGFQIVKSLENNYFLMEWTRDCQHR